MSMVCPIAFDFPLLIKDSLNFKKGNMGMANMYNKQRRQVRDGFVMMAR